MQFLLCLLLLPCVFAALADEQNDLPKVRVTEDPFQLVHNVIAPANASEYTSAVTVDNVKIGFTLKATFAENNEPRHSYTVEIINKSDKTICGVTFNPNSDTTDVTNLDRTKGILFTKDLKLAPGASAHQFGFVGKEYTTPTILSLKYCYDQWPKSANALFTWIIFPAILLLKH